MKPLIIYFSRTKTTKKLAEEIAKRLECKIEPIVTKKYDNGLLGLLSAGYDTLVKTKTKFEPMRNNPSAFDIVLIGTPVWVNTCSDPVRTFLSDNKGRFNDVAFFCTYGRNVGVTFKEMSDLVGKKPKATVGFHENEIKHKKLEKLDDFIELIKKPLNLY
ncbi:MAG: flavodoxin family protein [Candidatus Hodarchaeota archaeon]